MNNESNLPTGGLRTGGHPFLAALSASRMLRAIESAGPLDPSATPIGIPHVSWIVAAAQRPHTSAGDRGGRLAGIDRHGCCHIVGLATAALIPDRLDLGRRDPSCLDRIEETGVSFDCSDNCTKAPVQSGKKAPDITH